MSTNRNADRAKHLLRHYLFFAVQASGNKYDGDCNSEIGEIVDAIIAAVVEELQAQPAPGFAQPSMFAAGEDTPLFTLPEDAAEPVIELVYGALSVTTRDLCRQVIAASRTPAECWLRLESMRNNGDIPQTQYDEIKKMADFIEAD